jgi:hypothetical protein
VPEKADTDAPRRRSRPAPSFRRPTAELVQRAARRVVRGGKASFSSQSAFRAALIAQLRRDEPLATIGGGRLRRLLVGVPGVRIQVRYTERHDARPLDRCPVCGSELTAIRNRTLSGDTVTLGHRCRRCEYWTHAARRVPVRYTFSQAGIDGRSLRRAAGP